jgi:molybdopterin molybdotransferase
MSEVVTQGLLPVEQAVARLLTVSAARVRPDTVPVEQADGRVLLDDIHAACDVPPWDNSAMDGYALDAEQVDVGQTLPVSQRIAAGVPAQPLVSGTAARIFTGAPMPDGANAVVMQENCELDAGVLTINQQVIPGENVRRRGADIQKGSLLFPAGHRLRPQDTGVLAATGIAGVRVGRPPVIALLTTGAELVRPGTPLAAGQIYDSNRFVLDALLRRLGLQVKIFDVVEDSLEATEQALLEAAGQADVIVSSGGVSSGEEDHVRHALSRCGQLDIWKLALKPGKPFVFGSVGTSLFFGLPGNPVSSFVTFVLLVRPALLAMMGGRPDPVRGIYVPAGFARASSGERQEYLRVKLTCTYGGLSLEPQYDQSSGVLSSLSQADGLAVIPPHTIVSPDTPLIFLPFDTLIS